MLLPGSRRPLPPPPEQPCRSPHWPYSCCGQDVPSLPSAWGRHLPACTTHGATAPGQAFAAVLLNPTCDVSSTQSKHGRCGLLPGASLFLIAWHYRGWAAQAKDAKVGVEECMQTMHTFLDGVLSWSDQYPSFLASEMRKVQWYFGKREGPRKQSSWN